MDDKHLDLLLDIQKSLGGLHAKYDSQEKDFAEHKEDDEKAHARITSLEETRSEIKGGWSLLLVAVAVVSSLVTLLAHAWTGQ